MTGLNTDVRYIKGIGEARAKALEKLGIKTLRDLVCFFPRTYEDRTRFCEIRELDPGETACVRAMVSRAPVLSRVRRGLELVKLKAVDDTGELNITYFNQAYLKNQIKEGQTYIFFGRNDGTRKQPAMTNPEFEREGETGLSVGRVLPVYRLTAGISPKMMRSAVRQGLAACGEVLPNALPEAVRERQKLCQARYAYENIHFPSDFGALGIARRRLVFEELFVLACAMGRLRSGREARVGLVMSPADLEEFFERMPFQPTAAQKRAALEAVSDMQSGVPMNRLLQGDVGSGKTLVAAACIWFVWKSGYQSAFMAPTEILAEQHFETLMEFFEPFGLHVGKLTGSMTKPQKRKARESLASGEIDLAVGTHALLSEGVQWSKFGLAIIDEQHRFGVSQRSALSEKGASPHVLVMSATPIPRTLALIIYGDLDVSVLDELPPGRQVTETFAVGEKMRERIYGFTRRLVSEGRQVFIVCPMIEENEELTEGLKSAEAHALELSAKVFPELRVACVHGKMKAKEKDALMSAFARGETDVLVSTTVIEVGVDVPNAALMVVENAERFGLSQLHQLRGRVGRGAHKSYCVLFSESQNEDTRARLEVMCKTNDGFRISEEDLRLRGPGDFFGARQHGLPEMRIADLCSDMDVLKSAQDAAALLLKDDKTLQKPENRKLLQRVNELFELGSL